MEKEYLSSDKRLSHYFENSRDKWKTRSLKNQEEKRELLIQIRDLKRSKEKWKTECLKLRLENKELKSNEKKTKELLMAIIAQ